MPQQKSSLSDVDKVIVDWIKEQLDNGEDPEIIKESLLILNQDPGLVDRVLEEREKKERKVGDKGKEIKKQTKKEKSEKEGKLEEKSIEEKIEEIKKEIKQDVISVPSVNVVDEPIRMNIPKENIPKNEELYVLEHKKPMSNLMIKEKILETYLKSNIAYILIFIGICLMLIGVYVYFYL